jgi:hypothetical protein
MYYSSDDFGGWFTLNQVQRLILRVYKICVLKTSVWGDVARQHHPPSPFSVPLMLPAHKHTGCSTRSASDKQKKQQYSDIKSSNLPKKKTAAGCPPVWHIFTVAHRNAPKITAIYALVNKYGTLHSRLYESLHHPPTEMPPPAVLNLQESACLLKLGRISDQ